MKPFGCILYFEKLFGAETPRNSWRKPAGFRLPENERMTGWKISTVNEDVLPIQELIIDPNFRPGTSKHPMFNK